MITSPVGDDAKPWLRQFLAGPGTFALGAATAGALIGFTLQSLGGLLPAGALHGAVVVAAAALLLRPILFTALRPPSGRWMVPRGWSRFGRPGYSLLFGAALGTGFATPITTGTVYLLALLVAAAETPFLAASIFGAFGLARAIPLVVVGRCLSRRVFLTPFAVGVDRNGIVRGKVANPAYDNLTLLARLLVAGAEDEPARAPVWFEHLLQFPHLRLLEVLDRVLGRP